MVSDILKRICIFQIINTGFFIKAVVADNHFTNVNVFNTLLDKFEGYNKNFETISNSPKNVCF